MENIFTRLPHEYKRNIDIIGSARLDSAYYLHRMSNKPFEECLAFVEEQTAFGGPMGVIDREVLCLTKDTPGNRRPLATTFTHYVNEIIQTERLVSPSLAVYLNPKENHSLISQYIAGNIKARAEDKAAMFAAEAAGDKMLAAFKDLQQTSRKLNNNALSGGHVSDSTILYNKSAHSTLTSTCRSATSYGNANNEKFIAGNRHYWSVEVVKANVISIARLTDKVLLQQAMDTFNLVTPSVEDVMDCITYSSDLYWKDTQGIGEIREIVEKLLPIERAAFVYVSDMFHLAKHNPEFVRQFLGELSRKVTSPVDDPDSIIKSMDSDLKAFVSLLCAKELKGKTIKGCREFCPQDYMTIAATANNVMTTLRKYALLIKALWVTDNMPASTAAIPSIIRRAAVTSDTDSTIFTVQYWTNWYVGKDDFSEQSMAIANTVIYLSSQLIMHVLAMMSANMGIDSKSIHRIAMKNEYSFPVFCLTSRAKHYYAYISAREGNVYEEMDVELKGVALRNSNVPKAIMKKLRKLICDIMDNIIAEGQLSLREVLRRVVTIEWEIKNSVLQGRYDHMSVKQVKSISSYARGADDPSYANYAMWEEVFADKYGHTEAPPYRAVKVSVEAKNTTALKHWISRMEDRVIAEKFEAWCTKMNKKDVSNLLLPESIIAVKGIPQEIIEGVNVRKIIFGTLEAFYLVLESLGFFVSKPDNNKNITRLLSDYYHPDDFNDPDMIIEGELENKVA